MGVVTPIFRHKLANVNTLDEIYDRYQDGGEYGWYAYVQSSTKYAWWNHVITAWEITIYGENDTLPMETPVEYPVQTEIENIISLTSGPIFTHELPQAGTLTELYNRYPDGGEYGWYAFIVENSKYAWWNHTLTVPTWELSIYGENELPQNPYPEYIPPSFPDESKLKDLSNLPIFRYLKDPENTLSELYANYPNGGQDGWHAFVRASHTFAYWDIVTERWKLLPGSETPEVDIDGFLGINRATGSTTKVLTEKGDMVDLSNVYVLKVTGKSLISDSEITRLASVTNQDISGLATTQSVTDGLALKVDKVTGKSLILDSEITRLASVTNQDISGLATIQSVTDGLALKVDKVTGKSLVLDTEISKIHTHNNFTALNALLGVNTGDQTDITGNAGTATRLQTSRTINGVSFDGSANITINAVDATSRIASSLMGVANGVATLDSNGIILTTQLPSYVDDVLEYANLASFPATGETGKIYVAKDTNKTYRWSGSVYVYITSGAVDSVNGYTGIVVLSKSDVGLSNVVNALQWHDGNHPTTTTGYGLPAYPTTLPASDVYAWAKAATKPSYSYSEITSKPTYLSQFTNDLGNYGGWITGINSSMVTTALGYTPLPTRTFGSAANNNTGDFVPSSGTLGNSITLGTVYNGTSNQSVPTNLIGGFSNGYVYNFTQSQIQSWLGLGSNAYTSTAYLPLAGGTMSNTNLVGNLNAQYLGDKIGTGYFYENRGNSSTPANDNRTTGGYDVFNATNGYNYPVANGYGAMLNFNTYYPVQLYFSYSGDDAYFRTNSVDSPSTWKTIYHSGNLTSNLTTNYLPKWNGSSMANSLIREIDSHLLLQTSSTPFLSINDGIGFVNFGIDTGTGSSTFYNTSTYHRFLTQNGSLEALSINSNGVVNIYSTTQSTSPTLGALVVGGGIGADHVRANNFYGSAANLTSFPTLNQNTTGSAATLTTSRTIWGQSFNGSGNISGAITGATTGTFSGDISATNFILSSDKTLKTNIQLITKDYSKLNLVSFNFKDKLDELRFGTIAQDLISDGFSEFVVGNKEGEYKVKYIDLLIAKLSSAENRIKLLENKLYGST